MSGAVRATAPSLADACDFIRGVTFDAADASEHPGIGKTAVLRAGNIQDTLELRENLIWVPDAIVSDEQRLRKNDIAICMSSGSPDVVGKTARVPVDVRASIGSFCGIIRPKHPEEALYLSFFFRSAAFRRHRDLSARGANIQNLRFSQLRSIKVSIPPDQARVAMRLEHADRVRRNRKYALQLTSSLLPAMFQRLFGDPASNRLGWPRRSFEAVAPSRLGKMLDARQQTGRHGRPYLRNENVQWDRFDLRSVSVMDFDAEDRKEFVLLPGDLLICEGGEPGRAAIWRSELPECYFQKALHRARVEPSLAVPEYLLYLLWALARNGGLADYVTSATIAHLTGEKLKEALIPVPPLPRQQEFVAAVRRVARLRRVQEEALRQAEHLTASLLYQAFRNSL